MLHHVALELHPADVDASVAFFGALGLRRVDPPPALAERSVWLEAGDGTQVHLLLTDEPTAVPRGHAAFVAREYEATLAALRALGHEPQPRGAHWGSPRAFVRGPGGHRVEIMAFAPGR